MSRHKNKQCEINGFTNRISHFNAKCELCFGVFFSEFDLKCSFDTFCTMEIKDLQLITGLQKK